MPDVIIEVENLCKTFKISKRANGLPGRVANLFVPKYNYKKAVSDISFEIVEGEAVGFIGANGAGKSTTIKMLSGILCPDAGNIEVAGYIPFKQRKEYVANIGVVFGQKSQLQWDLPVIESFELLKHIYSIPKNLYKENLALFTEILALSSFIEQPVRQLSLGQKMRADIAAALLHSPKIIFFDEPTIGLDVVAKEKIRDFVRYINKEKSVTVIFTTHDMQDIEQTCNRLILIDKGEKVYDGTVKGLLDTYAKEKKLIVDFPCECEIDPFENITVKNLENYQKEIIFNPENISTKSLISQICEKYDVLDLSIENIGIESIVRQIYEGGIQVK